MAEQHIFDAIATPLEKGVNLVEASAGTGKTYAIAMLVLRALVELPITIDQVLVVTFTVATTEELKERIRTRISCARDVLRGVNKVEDEVLRKWAATIDRPDRAIELLTLALLDIDRIAIHTIHGFCQRMLTDQALESGQAYDFELVDDTAKITSQLVQDFWRSRLYTMDVRYCHLITSRYSSPEDLYKSIAGAESPLVQLVPEDVSFSLALANLEKFFEALQIWWSDHGDALKCQVDSAIADGFFKKDFIQQYPDWLKTLENGFALNIPPLPQSLQWLQKEQLLQYLNGQKLRGMEKKQTFVANWQLPGRRVDGYLESVAWLINVLRVELALSLRDNLNKILNERTKMSFDNLVTGMAAAVKGRNGSLLCRQIGSRYRIVLIDEFQDTDSAQWQIFSTLFSGGHHFLYLIGDPKQAIYRFRGADIYSYFAARESADSHLTLTRNYRSHPGLLGGVNRLFAEASIAGQPYHPIDAAKSRENGCLTASGSELPALIYCQLAACSEANPRWSSGAANEIICQWVVQETARMIGAGSTIRVALTDSGGSVQRTEITAADIAVLVRSNKQAEQYQDHFEAAGIPAVISSKKPVFAAPECGELLLILQAIAMPSDAGALKRAMSSTWFGLSGDEHHRICLSASAFDQWFSRFQHYYRLWSEMGFFPMMTTMVEDENVFVHLCSEKSGERRIANILHLAELVQKEEQEKQFGISQILFWLQKMISDARIKQETELRLESDEMAVSILTMHSAKGLEYPIVFCPSLLSAGRYDDSEALITKCHDDNGTLICDLGSELFDKHRQLSIEEQNQEELRLAYVAVTRAQLRSYLFWADVAERGGYGGSAASPLGRLLFPHGTGTFQQQQDLLRSFENVPDTGYNLIEADKMVQPSYKPLKVDTSLLKARKRGTRSLVTGRTVTSFSGLSTLTDLEKNETLSGAFDEIEKGAISTESSGLPGGVRFGNIVHDALEMLEFSKLASMQENFEELGTICRRYNLTVDLAELQQLLFRCVTTQLLSRLSPVNFTLAELAREKLVKEMQFTLRMAAISTTGLNRIFTHETAFLPLSYRELEGYLNGFIDLIGEYGEKIYIIDYKTNNLGNAFANYQQDDLSAAMREHNYGLQYLLYTLVVHRYLKTWQADYSYNKHFGGVMYLFVRGMSPDTPGSGVYFARPEEKVILQLDRYFDRGIS